MKTKSSEVEMGVDEEGEKGNRNMFCSKKKNYNQNWEFFREFLVCGCNSNCFHNIGYLAHENDQLNLFL